MISKEDLTKSLFYLNKFETIKVHKSWGISFILFGLANLFTSSILIIILNSNNNLFLNYYGQFIYIINFIFVVYGGIKIILSYRDKFIGLIFPTLDLKNPQRNKQIIKSPYFQKFYLIILFLLFLIGNLIYFSYQTLFSIPFPDQIFISYPFLTTGIILILVYFVQKKVFSEISFKELLITGIILVIGFSPVLYFCQSFFFPNYYHLFNDLQSLMLGNVGIHEINLNLLNIFLILSIIPSLFLISIGIYQYSKLNKILREDNK